MSADTGDLSSKIVIAGVVAAIVGGVAAFSGVDLVMLLVAVAASIGAFWLLDGLLARSGSTHIPAGSSEIEPGAAPRVHGVSGGPLPVTTTMPLAPPTIGAEPARVSANSEAQAGSLAGGVSEPRLGARLDPAMIEPESVEIKANSQGKSRAFSIRVAKHGHALVECEDAVAVDPRRAVVAVADGASSSFGAHLWAAVLTRQFVAAPPKPLSVTSFSNWLAEARGVLGSEMPSIDADDADESSGSGWWNEEGARQGAYSTVVGVAIMTDGDARVATVMCLGDSSAFVLTGSPGERTLRRSLPYEDASQFGSHPALLASMPDRRHDEPTWTTIPTSPGDLIVLASDAVAEWFLGDPRRFSMLDGNEPDAISARLVAERTDGAMVNDDLTLAVLELAP